MDNVCPEQAEIVNVKEPDKRRDTCFEEQLAYHDDKQKFNALVSIFKLLKAVVQGFHKYGIRGYHAKRAPDKQC